MGSLGHCNLQKEALAVCEQRRTNYPMHQRSIIRPYMSENIIYNTLFSLTIGTGWPEQTITKTCLYNFDSLKPHFYIVKLGLTGIYIIFHISAQNIDCGYSLEPHRMKKYQNFLSENFTFHFLVVTFSV